MEQAPPVNVTTAAKALGLSAYTIRAWIRQRRIAHIRLGRSVRIPVSEVQRLLRIGLTPPDGV